MSNDWFETFEGPIVVRKGNIEKFSDIDTMLEGRGIEPLDDDVLLAIYPLADAYDALLGVSRFDPDDWPQDFSEEIRMIGDDE